MSYLTTGRKSAMYGTQRTGVRLVLTNTTDPRRVDEYSTWYDEYGDALLRIGRLVNDFRFEKTSATCDEADPRFAEVYDIATPDPATAWPDTEPGPLYAAARFRLIEGTPDQAQWLEIFVTDDPQPENAFARALTAVGDHARLRPSDGRTRSGSCPSTPAYRSHPARPDPPDPSTRVPQLVGTRGGRPARSCWSVACSGRVGRECVGTRLDR